jgi:hypothetical protein
MHGRYVSYFVLHDIDHVAEQEKERKELERRWALTDDERRKKLVNRLYLIYYDINLSSSINNRYK